MGTAKTYPEMNKEIVKLLRMGNNPVDLYAAARIAELEQEVKRLQERVAELEPRLPDESQVYGNDCPGGKCDF